MTISGASNVCKRLWVHKMHWPVPWEMTWNYKLQSGRASQCSMILAADWAHLHPFASGSKTFSLRGWKVMGGMLFKKTRMSEESENVVKNYVPHIIGLTTMQRQSFVLDDTRYGSKHTLPKWQVLIYFDSSGERDFFFRFFSAVALIWRLWTSSSR